ncbi:hypothetical protein C8R44DRAFT_734844 [Mycena epipterygia]|nr:hypothetical protein C8R44DRAFT_734844 [Mycena epipterygia]
MGLYLKDQGDERNPPSARVGDYHFWSFTLFGLGQDERRVLENLVHIVGLNEGHRPSFRRCSVECRATGEYTHSRMQGGSRSRVADSEADKMTHGPWLDVACRSGHVERWKWRKDGARRRPDVMGWWREESAKARMVMFGLGDRGCPLRTASRQSQLFYLLSNVRLSPLEFTGMMLRQWRGILVVFPWKPHFFPVGLTHTVRYRRQAVVWNQIGASGLFLNLGNSAPLG